MSEQPPVEGPQNPPPPAGPPASAPSDFTSFYQATVAPLRNYLARLLKSPADAQDVAQDAYVRLHHASSGRTSKRLLYTVARRLALNHLRGRDRARVRAVDDTTLSVAASPDPAVERIVDARHELARLEVLILQLPGACRQVFLLRRVHDLTLQEIADRLAISPKTVENHMTYACRLVRQAYDKAEAEAAVTAAAARRHRANPPP